MMRRGVGRDTTTRYERQLGWFWLIRAGCFDDERRGSTARCFSRQQRRLFSAMFGIGEMSRGALLPMCAQQRHVYSLMPTPITSHEPYMTRFHRHGIHRQGVTYILYSLRKI